MPSRLGLVVALVAALAGCAAFAAAPQTRLTTEHADPVNLSTGPDRRPVASRPASRGSAAIAADGCAVLLRLAHNAWPAITGILVQAERTGVTACVADPGWEFMVTSQFICTPASSRTVRGFQRLSCPAGAARQARWLPGFGEA